MSKQKSLQFWTIVLLGLFYISVRCDARAVNVSNTWTMPQEGLNVFYRFFRDRISWFEADAVCQFHHANLVTVDNSFQFDATRDLLRELDVNDIVWIGLMRPQSSERFMWSNSRPLVTDTGYWAESLPLMDAPLCAVIDPIRDYRWHALRCGGPETASFLCEMPVPSWADACILKDMPNLTMQYMADTASIELIRNCEEEGLLRQTCKGKQDRERAVRELICPRERLEAQRINDITNSHFKSLQIINSIRTDNNENNDIELLPLGQNYEANSEQIPEQPPTEKNTVQRLIEQFNVDELMQADEPLNSEGFKITGEKPIPVKKASVAAKRTILIRNYPRKSQLKTQNYQKQAKKQHQQKLQEPALEDMMMGDQPQHDGEAEMLERVQDDDDVSNEIMEPLPHKKKILPQDLKTMPTITERPTIVENEESEEKKSHESVEEKAIEQKPQQVKENERKIEASTTTVTEVSTTAAAAVASTAINVTPTTTTTTTSTTTTTTTTAASSSSSSSTTVPAIATTLPTTAVTSDEPVFSSSSTVTSSPYGVSSQSTISPTSGLTPLIDMANSANTSIVHDNQQQTTMVSPATATATLPPATVGHPMHPQQPRSNIITEETQHPHMKESADNSHFIPPMLMVKSHYVPPGKHEHEHQHGHEQHGTFEYHENHHDSVAKGDVEDIGQRLSAAIGTTTTVVTARETDAIKHIPEHEQLNQQQSIAATATATATTIESATVNANVATKIDGAVTSTTISATDAAATTNSELVTAKDTHASIIDAMSSNPTKGNADNNIKQTATTILKPINILENNKSKIGNLDATSTTTTTTTMPVTTTAQISFEDSSTQTSTIKSVPSVTTTTTTAKITTSLTEGSSVVALLLKETEKPINVMPPKITNDGQHLAVEAGAAPTTTTKTILAAVAEIQAEVAAGIVDTLKIAHGKEKMFIVATTDMPETTTTTTTTITTTTAAPIITTKHAPIATTKHAPIKATTKHAHAHNMHAARKPTKATHIRTTTTEEPATTHNFLNEETEPPFKPNRHRELTQPETVSYFKKILG